MKVRIKSFNGVLPYYLTEGREYEFSPVVNLANAGDIISDDECKDFILLNECEHLGGGSWEVVE